ncbi:MAG: hypothetical protein OHK0044_29960 [Burkholderiaceae bacterium]
MTARKTRRPTHESQAVFADGSTPHGIGCPRTRPRGSRFVAKVDLYSDSAMNERSDVYWLSTNRARSHWFLWTSYYDDELGEGWVHQVYAYVPRGGLAAREAAMALLACGWRAERDRGRLTEAPEGVVREGLLTAADVEQVARSVWPEPTTEADTNERA